MLLPAAIISAIALRRQLNNSNVSAAPGVDARRAASEYPLVGLPNSSTEEASVVGLQLDIGPNAAGVGPGVSAARRVPSEHPLDGLLSSSIVDTTRTVAAAVNVSDVSLTHADVEFAKGLVNCPHGVRSQNSSNSSCEERSLLLDVYGEYVQGQPLKPAILIIHGGCNKYGGKRGAETVSSLSFYVRHGFIGFSADIRLQGDLGNYPGEDFVYKLDNWSTTYPAVRDTKAAIRFIRANAALYGVDPDRLVVSGHSAGGMDVLSAAASAEDDFTSEFQLEDDPTVSTINIEQSAQVQVIVDRWGPSWALQALSLYKQMERGEQPDPLEAFAQRSDFTGLPLPPLIQFHGENDTMINISYAHQIADIYREAGVKHSLHILSGASHSAWGIGCPLRSQYEYCPETDKVALHFIKEVFGSLPPGNSSENLSFAQQAGGGRNMPHEARVGQPVWPMTHRHRLW